MKNLTIFTYLLLISCFCNAQKYRYPVFDRTDNYLFHLDSVEVTSDSTILYFTYAAEAYSWANISPSSYIKDKITGKEYKIKNSSGLPLQPLKRHFNYSSQVPIRLSFEPIRNLRSFDFIECSSDNLAFNIYGIDLFSQYKQKYSLREEKRFTNQADFYSTINDSLALEYRAQELEARNYLYGIQSEAASLSLYQIAFLYNALGDNDKAIEYGLQALDCQAKLYGKENKEIPAYPMTLGTIAGFYYDAGNEIEAIRCMQECIDIRRKIRDEKGYINDLNYILSNRVSGSSKDGLSSRIGIVKQELISLPDYIGNNSLSLVNILKELAVLFNLTDDYLNAIKSCDNAISILKSNGKEYSEEYAEVLASMCKYQRNYGLKDETIVSGEAAKQLFDSLGIMSIKYAELLGDLAWAYGQDYNFEKSIQYQKTASIVYENAKDWISLAETYNSISHYYQSAEKLDNAELYIKKAIDILNAHGNAELIVRERAELTGNRYINNPHALFSIKTLIDTDQALFYQTLARIYQKQGKIIEAIDTEEKSGSIIKSMGDDIVYAVHLMTLSEYYSYNYQFSQAINFAKNSVKLFDDSRISSAVAKIGLAHTYCLAGDTINAIKCANDAISTSIHFKDNECRITAQSQLASIYFENHDYEKAEISLSEILDYSKTLIGDKNDGITTEQRQRMWAKYDGLFLLYRRTIELSERDGALLSKLYDYVLFSKSFLLDSETHKYNSQNITWLDIQKVLSNEDIAIDFITTRDTEKNSTTYHALVIDKNCTSPHLITLYNESDLMEIKQNDSRNITDILGRLIWSPIVSRYPQIRNIYFSPDGALQMLPIEYYNVDDTTNMFEFYNMYRLSSTKELIVKRSLQHLNSAVLYGNLDYNHLQELSNSKSENVSDLMRGISERGGFDPLPNTYIETQKINDLLVSGGIPTLLYSGEEGTEESFCNLTNQRICIIHLATHGMYVSPNRIKAQRQENNFGFLEVLTNEKDPVKEDVALTHSFLVMSGGNKLIHRESISDKTKDGILTAKEISRLDLNGLDLVVLSACESALGDIDSDGIYGLQRGFKKAGANTILMSLDKVDDEATRLLMVEFYKNLMNGKSKLQSLRDAQMYLRQVEDGKYDDPKYWATFIMLDGLN